MTPAIGDLLEAGRARARGAFAERMPRGFGPRDGAAATGAERPLADRPWESLPPEVGRALRLELALRARRLVAAG